MTAATDVPAGLEFVDPAETDPTYRVTLFAAPGQGKSVAAASAPTPILVLSADRPSAYRFARKHHGHGRDDLREVRYQGPHTLDEVYRYIRDGNGIRTLVIDPIGNIVDHLVEVFPKRADGDPDYQAVNRKVLNFIKSFRAFDVNVVLVAHEKVNDGKKGDGRIYPQIGGMTLVNKTMAEMDIVAHVQRVVTGDDENAEEVWIGQLQPRGLVVTKESTGVLGDRRRANLARWFEVANEALATDEEPPVDAGMPWADDSDAKVDEVAAELDAEEITQPELGEAA